MRKSPLPFLQERAPGKMLSIASEVNVTLDEPIQEIRDMRLQIPTFDE